MLVKLNLTLGCVVLTRIVVGCCFLFGWFHFGRLHIQVLSFEFWNSSVSMKSYFLLLLDAFFIVHLMNTLFLILIILSPLLQAIYSSKIDFHQTLIKKILVNLMNTLAILRMVKWIKSSTFHLFHNISVW